jgi:hypothetical protein
MMQTMTRRVAVTACSAILLASALGAAPAPDQAADPLIGYWKINWSKSEGPPRQQDLACKFDMTPTGRQWTVYITDEKGKKSTRVSPAIDDGKTYPVTGHEGSDAITLKRVDSHNWVETLWKNGKPTFQGTWKLSPDGKFLAIASSVRHYIRTYEKVPQ